MNYIIYTLVLIFLFTFFRLFISLIRLNTLEKPIKKTIEFNNSINKEYKNFIINLIVNILSFFLLFLLF